MQLVILVTWMNYRTCMTKIAITGHTSGIGKACAEVFSAHEIFGYSTSTGWDLAEPWKIMKDILRQDCDVFINNAYYETSQSELLKQVHAHWKNTNRTIINIGSYITDYPRLEKALDSEPWEYRDNKQDLLATFRTIAQSNTQCNVHMISPGPVDTPMIKHIDTTKMHACKVASLVNLMLETPYLKEVTLYD